MIKRYILHLEFHWGYRPRISFRRAPRHGDRVMDGGEMGTLIACQACSGVGLLHQADVIKLPEGVMPNLYPEGARVCKCINLADEFMPPSVRIGDAEARRRNLILTTECEIHREI